MTGIYSLTIFTSAFLLFLIQPMISKLLLPHLGGSPAVWNTAMMVFQSLLLLGYCYAHATAKWLGAKKQAILHLLLVLVALAWLPIAVKTEFGFTSIDSPIRWVVLALLTSVGFPFFVLSANAPLIQFWLSNTTHKDAKNPYFLYSASNIGSLLALFGYPFIIEPLFTLPGQTKLWSAVFIFFTALIIGCAWLLKKHYRPMQARVTQDEDTAAPTTAQRLHWIVLAFFPSSLLLGVTTFITTDIASIPLFWVVPLAVYLSTFILAFARTPLMVDRALNAQLVLVPLVVLAMVFKINFISQVLILHLWAFFAIAMGCHGTLARQKPSVKYLTEYFVWISFGGVLGGIFNSLIAPVIFTEPVEYPLIFLLSLMARPILITSRNPTRDLRFDLIVGIGFAVLLWLGFRGFDYVSHYFAPAVAHYNNSIEGFFSSASGDFFHTPFKPTAAVLLYLFIMLAVIKTYKRPLRFTLIMLAVIIVVPLADTGSGSAQPGGQMIYAERNFFGVNRVFRWTPLNAMLLMHGTTTHGMQGLSPADHLHPATYYGALSEVFAALPAPLAEAPVAAIGLGTGTVACLGHKNQSFDFYEIDPAVAAIARNPNYFTYLRDCGPTIHITLGDGRLSIAHAANHRYGMLIMDAFSSDAIPLHLLTREAFALYNAKLAEHGIIAVNISNRHLDLVPVMAALAQDAHMSALLKRTTRAPSALEFPSVWVVMAHSNADLGPLLQDNRWKPLTPTNSGVWTDNYSNILQTLF